MDHTNKSLVHELNGRNVSLYVENVAQIVNLYFKGATENIPIIDFIVDILNEPTPEQEECHRPKPILLNTGSVRRESYTHYVL